MSHNPESGPTRTVKLYQSVMQNMQQLGKALQSRFISEKPALPPKVRTDEEIKAEYTRVVCELGHRVFSHQQEERAIAQLHQRCEMLQAEGRAAQEAAAKAKATGLKAVPDEAAEVQAS